jgi:hypothetical protein
LVEKRVIKNGDNQVKILGDGELSKKLSVFLSAVSGTAREKIEKAGGTVESGSPDEDGEQKPEQTAEKPGESAAEANDDQQEGSVDGE